MEIVIAPDQRLRVKTKPVDKVDARLKQVIREMERLTKTFVDPEGVGLASTQIGRDEQLFVAKQTDGSFKAYLNPTILSCSKKQSLLFEGCLSIPKYWSKISRPVAITVSYMDKEGNQIKERLTGFAAHVFQHEYDHLQGRLFMDIVLDQRARLWKVVGRDRAGAEIFEEVPL